MTDPSAGPVGHDEGPTDAATLITAYEVLADKTRCAVITYLATVNSSVSLDALVDDVAVSLVSAGVDPQVRERIEIRLHHIHLPKMDNAGVIDYDPDEQLIEPTGEITLPLQLLTRAAASRT